VAIVVLRETLNTPHWALFADHFGVSFYDFFFSLQRVECFYMFWQARKKLWTHLLFYNFFLKMRKIYENNLTKPWWTNFFSTFKKTIIKKIEKKYVKRSPINHGLFDPWANGLCANFQKTFLSKSRKDHDKFFKNQWWLFGFMI
jgi:hypothetical protein